MREKIRTAYNEQFDYLLQVAEKQQVPASVLANRENTIRVKTTPSNILVLQNNISTDAFYQEQIERIMSYSKPIEPIINGGKQPLVQPVKRIRQASLLTKTKLPITNTEDIDHYLEGLREQLLKLLADHDGVMITK